MKLLLLLVCSLLLLADCFSKIEAVDVDDDKAMEMEEETVMCRYNDGKDSAPCLYRQEGDAVPRPCLVAARVKDPPRPCTAEEQVALQEMIDREFEQEIVISGAKPRPGSGPAAPGPVSVVGAQQPRPRPVVQPVTEGVARGMQCPPPKMLHDYDYDASERNSKERADRKKTLNKKPLLIKTPTSNGIYIIDPKDLVPKTEDTRRKRETNEEPENITETVVQKIQIVYVLRDLDLNLTKPVKKGEERFQGMGGGRGFGGYGGRGIYGGRGFGVRGGGRYGGMQGRRFGQGSRYQQQGYYGNQQGYYGNQQGYHGNQQGYYGGANQQYGGQQQGYGGYGGRPQFQYRGNAADFAPQQYGQNVYKPVGQMRDSTFNQYTDAQQQYGGYQTAPQGGYVDNMGYQGGQPQQGFGGPVQGYAGSQGYGGMQQGYDNGQQYRGQQQGNQGQNQGYQGIPQGYQGQGYQGNNQGGYQGQQTQQVFQQQQTSGQRADPAADAMPVYCKTNNDCLPQFICCPESIDPSKPFLCMVPVPS